MRHNHQEREATGDRRLGSGARSTTGLASDVRLSGLSLRIISVITDPVVVDRILLHRKSKGIESPFARAPPAA